MRNAGFNVKEKLVAKYLDKEDVKPHWKNAGHLEKDRRWGQEECNNPRHLEQVESNVRIALDNIDFEWTPVNQTNF